MSIRRALLLVVVAMALANGSSRPAAAQKAWTWRYVCIGSMSGMRDGPFDYRLPLTITRKHQAYELVWGETDRPTAVGIGIREGRHLSVALVGTVEFGVAHYVVTDGRLSGTWSMGWGRVYSEQCALVTR